jgi:iron complex outermembrane receptor protein
VTRTATIGGVATTVDREVGPNSQNRYPRNGDERFYDINYPCRVDIAQAGASDAPGTSAGPGASDPEGDLATCGTEFDRRYNPSNTGNIRGSSRFTLTDKLVLTVDPSYQYVKANGGGTVTANEGLRDINPAQPADPDGAGPLPRPAATATPAQCRAGNNAFQFCVPGYLGGTPFFGRDLNGDGDELDTVSVLAPSQTQTRRYGVIAGLRYELDDNHQVRVNYTLDHARHRQTGEVGLLKPNGEPFDVFPVNDPEEDENGFVLQKRDRLSFAILHQVSGEYRGEFLDDSLTVTVGLRAPFFTRRLKNNCATSSASGFVECFGENTEGAQDYADFNPTIQGPQRRTFKYNKLLPNIGLIYDFTPQISGFASYAKGLSVPSTDNLYNSFFFARDRDEAKPDPETTDSFDGGLRYRNSRIQAQIAGWYTRFDNRQATAFDPELNASVFRNLGRVNKWGIDGSIAYEPIRELTLYAFGSYNKSKIKDDIQIGALPIVGGEQLTCADRDDLTASQRTASCAFTAGNREAGSPKYTYGFSGVGRLGPVELGVTAKKTGPRNIFDNGAAIFTGTLANLNDTITTNDPVQIFGSKVPAYWLVNLDARFKLDMLKGLEGSFIQLNVYNLFDKFYVGGFGGGLSQSLNTAGTQFGNPPNVQIGAPRTVSASLSLSF